MSDPGPGLDRILTPVFRGWKTITWWVAGVCIPVLILGLIGGHRFEATASLATVTTGRSISTSGLAAAFLGAQTGGGIQLTPAFVVELARMDGVLYNVGTSRDLSADGARVIDLLEDADSGGVEDHTIVRKMLGYVTSEFDGQTGIIDLTVLHRDSALARAVLERVINAVNVTFRDASRSQARQILEAQERRVDSAQAQLRRAEEDLVRFTAANRLVAPHSEEYVLQQNIQRAVTIAQTVYMQVLTDREAALSKELEEMPAVVVLDPPPPQLPPAPRGLLIRLFMLTIVIVVIIGSYLVLRDKLRRAYTKPNELRSPAFEALLDIPLAGPIIKRMGSRPAKRLTPGVHD